MTAHRLNNVLHHIFRILCRRLGYDYHPEDKRAGAGGHKEINRTNFTQKDIESGLKKEVVKKQLEMLKFRKEFPAFGFDAEMEIRTKPAAQI